MSSSNDVLLALHYQNDVLHPLGRIRVGLNDETTRTNLVVAAGRLLALARARAWTIVHVRIAFRPDYEDLPRNMPIFQSVREIGAVQDGQWGAEFFEPLSPRPTEFIVKHTSISAFCGTPLDSLLRMVDADRVHVAGVATHSVVESTVRDAADRGFNVVVVTDACAAARRVTHDAAIASMALMAEITTVGKLAEGNP